MTLSSLQPTLQINNIAVALRRNSLAKSMRLRIDLIKKQPVVIAPKRFSLETVESFLIQHQDWVRKQLAAVLAKKACESEVLYQGKTYKLISQPTERKRLNVRFDHEQQLIHHNTSPDLIKSRLKNVFKKEALSLAHPLCVKFANLLGISFKEVKIKDYKARWGSCRRDRILSFSWRLIMAPPFVLEYVCAHEIAHLVHFDHSPAFWQVMAEIYPNYQQAREWLKQNSSILFQQF